MSNIGTQTSKAMSGGCYPVFRREVFEKIGLYVEMLVRNQDHEVNIVSRYKGERHSSPHTRVGGTSSEKPSDRSFANTLSMGIGGLLSSGNIVCLLHFGILCRPSS